MPRATAAASARRPAATPSPTGRCHSASTRIRARTAGTPPTWSWWPCETTRRSTLCTPLAASHRAAVPSEPASTSTAAPGVCSSTASPCPTSIAVTVRPRGTARGTSRGTSETTPTRTAAATVAVAATRAPREPRRVSSHTTRTAPRRRAAGRCQPSSPPTPRRPVATVPTRDRAGPASHRTAPPAGTLTTARSAPTTATAEATAAAGTARRLAGTPASGIPPSRPAAPVRPRSGRRP